MSTFSITVDEQAISKMSPSISRESFGLILQRYVDEFVEKFVDVSQEVPCTYTHEEMMTICDQRLDDILSGRATTLSHDEVMENMSRKYQLAICFESFIR